MERERGGGDDEVEHEVDGEEVREEARREDGAEDLGQIELGRVWHDRESERLKRMRSARPDRPGAGRAPATSPAPSVSPKRNGYLLRFSDLRRYGSAKKTKNRPSSFDLEKCFLKPHCSKTQIALVTEPDGSRRRWTEALCFLPGGGRCGGASSYLSCL